MYRLVILMAAIAAVSCRNINNRIIGGFETSIEKHPYQVSITHSVSASYYDCGAGIINNKHVLTAAHCVEDYRYRGHELKVRVGTSYRTSGGVVYNGEKLFIHKYFRDYTLDYDVAVLRVQDIIKFSATVAPVGLVPIDEKPKTGEALILTGWGRIKYEAKQEELANVLHEVRIELIDGEVCRSAYKIVSPKLTPRMFCAGGISQPYKGSYKGDSGSPIVNERMQLVGIVSWGVLPNVTSYPGVFTDITNPEVRRFVEQSLLNKEDRPVN